MGDERLDLTRDLVDDGGDRLDELVVLGVPASVSAWEATTAWWSVLAVLAIWRAIRDAAAECERAIRS